jgi:hypothetical protein
MDIKEEKHGQKDPKKKMESFTRTNYLVRSGELWCATMQYWCNQ